MDMGLPYAFEAIHRMLALPCSSEVGLSPEAACMSTHRGHQEKGPLALNSV